MMSFTVLGMIGALVGLGWLARWARARHAPLWVLAVLVALAVVLGGAVGLFAPVALLQWLDPSATSYEDVLPYWVVSVPGVPALVVVAMVRVLRARPGSAPTG